MGALCLLVAACAGGAEGASLAESEPYDVIVLRQGDADGRLEVYPLPLPGRRVPQPFPGGALTVRTLAQPGEPLVIDWSAIESIELFESMLMKEAIRLTRAKNFAGAFDHLARLERDHPRWPRLDAAFAAFLRADAAARFKSGEPDHALAILQALYERSPDARGVKSAVEAVGSQILASAWKAEDYLTVGSTLAVLNKSFAALELEVVARWRGRLEQRSAEALAAAEAALVARKFTEARRRANQAVNLLPESTAARRLLDKIEKADPTARIGVIQSIDAAEEVGLNTPTARRHSRLIGGLLARLDDYAPTGGVYSSPLGDITTDDTKRTLRLRLNDGAIDSGIGPYTVARAVARLSEDRQTPLHALADRVASVSIERPATVVIRLRRAHARPEALLKGPLPAELTDLAAASWTVAERSATAIKFRRDAPGAGYQTIEERAFAAEQDAVDALLRGEIVVLANLPPWRVESVRRAPGVSIGDYRVPTLHCLLISQDSYLSRSREARRSLCYGVARERFVEEILTAGEALPGYQVLTAPLPAGRSLGDPLRYAYNDAITARPYQPRLAALLSAVARNDLKKTEADSAAAERPLTLIYPPTPIARLACQSIGAQLSALGLPVKLLETSEREQNGRPIAHDLRYAEISVGEPMVDAWRLFGPAGLAGDCSATLLNTLEELDGAINGRGVTESLQASHEILSGDLPIIPLWQTVDHYAFRTDLEGIPQETVDLYQTIDDWRLERRGGRR